MTKKYNYKEKKENGKNETGRPTDYNPDYCRDIVLFFEKAPKFQKVEESETDSPDGTTTKFKKIPAPLPTFFRYAQKIGVHDNTLETWCRDYPEFLCAYNAAKQLQKEWLTEIALSGMTPPASAIFIMKNVTDYKDKTETDVTVKTYEQISKQKKEYGFER